MVVKKYVQKSSHSGSIFVCISKSEMTDSRNEKHVELLLLIPHALKFACGWKWLDNYTGHTAWPDKGLFRLNP